MNYEALIDKMAATRPFFVEYAKTSGVPKFTVCGPFGVVASFEHLDKADDFFRRENARAVLNLVLAELEDR
jgi:hypothetical protein